MKTNYTGTDGTISFVMAWDSDNKDVGQGQQRITKIDDEAKREDVEITFVKPFQSVNPAYMAVEPTGKDQSKVKWVYFGKFPYPMNILCPGLMSKLGEDMKTGLTSMKSVLEKK